MKSTDESQNNGKTKSDEIFFVSDNVFDNNMSSTWSEMTPIEFVTYNVNALESPPEIIRLKDIESYGGIDNYISTLLNVMQKHLDY